MNLRPSVLALTLYVSLSLAGAARADLAPPRDPDDGGCLAGGLPWALPPIGLGVAFTIRQRAKRRGPS